jgi:hypothetical protein
VKTSADAASIILAQQRKLEMKSISIKNVSAWHQNSGGGGEQRNAAWRQRRRRK